MKLFYKMGPVTSYKWSYGTPRNGRINDSNCGDTVDGRNPAPPGMYKTLYKSWDKLPTSTGGPRDFWTINSNPTYRGISPRL